MIYELELCRNQLNLKSNNSTLTNSITINLNKSIYSMLIKIPSELSIVNFSNQELYFIGLFTELKIEGKYKFKKLNRNTVSEKMLDYEKHLQALIEKCLIKIVAEDDMSFTYCLTKPINTNSLQQVDIKLLDKNPYKPFPFYSSMEKTNFKDLTELKNGYNRLEENYLKLTKHCAQLKKIAEYLKEENLKLTNKSKSHE